MSACSEAVSTNGKTATGPRAGSGKGLLFFEVAAVALTTSGQSFIMPRGTGMKAGTKDGAAVGRCELRAICFFGFSLAQQSCERALWQLSPDTTVCAESSDSCAITLLLQPNRHPPAIQMDTLTARNKRTALVERNDFIRAAVYPRSRVFVEKPKPQKGTKRTKEK